MKTAQRHVAMMNPSPGPGLNTAGIMAPIVSQAVYSLLLFLLTNDGKVSVITLQLIISLNELMMKLTLKHRDGFFTRTVMGTMAGDALHRLVRWTSCTRFRASQTSSANSEPSLSSPR